MNLTLEKFEALLNEGETSTTDFKETHYFLPSGSGKDKTAEFTKDLLCLANTIRVDSAFILIGIKENKAKKGVVIGVTDNEIIDDATLQQKVKNKTFPSIKFYSYIIDYQDKKVVVIEIPVTWYERIPFPTVASSGLENGRVYIRRGTINDTAGPDEIMQIDAWFRSLSQLPDSGAYKSHWEKPLLSKMQQSYQKIEYPKKVSFDEASIQKLFGNEAAEDEDPTRLKQYYFKNETFESIAVDLPIRILVGHKGIGKSALFKISAAEDIEKHKIPIVIKPDDVAEIAQEEGNFLQIIRAWKVGITDIVRKKLLIFFHVKQNLFKDIQPDYNYEVSEPLKKFLSDLVDNNEIDSSLKDFAINFIEGTPVNVYIDDLDRGWRGGTMDIQRLSALLNAVRDLATTKNHRMQFKISLRSDVYFLVRTSDESTDKIDGSVVWHSWTNHEILIMLIKRIETYFGRDVDENGLLKSEQRYIAHYLNPIMEPRFTGNGKWENVPIHRVLMSLIRKRPRDLVKLLTLAARNARKMKSDLINTKHFQEIFYEYSQGRLQDTVNEYRTELPNIEKLLLEMKPSKKTKSTIDNFSFTRAELSQKLQNIMEHARFVFSKGNEADVKDLIHFLYKINFLTAKKELPTGEIDRKYFEESRYLSSGLADFGYDWEIHMAYRWALQPTSIDDIISSINRDY